MLSLFRGTPPHPQGLRRRPRLLGALAAVALAVAPALPGGSSAQAAAAPTKGYWFVAADGGIFSYGDAGFLGSTGNLKLNQPIVGMAPTPTGRGYWFVAADGGIFSFGDGYFYGSTGAMKLNRPIVGMAPSPSGRGYWFVASDGGIFSFGDAAFYGSTGAIRLAKPIVGMAATPSGRGYWFVASDGGVFNYGDAAFYGSGAGSALKSPVVGISATPTGKGYYLATTDGTVVAFGDAVFRGSMGGKALKSPIAGLTQTSTGAGYWLVAADGGIFSFGDAGFYGSTGALRLNRAIVGMAAAPQKSGALPAPGGPGGTLPTIPNGGTSPTTNPGTTPTTVPAAGVDWGPAGTITALTQSSGKGNAYRPWMSDNGRYLVFDSDGKEVVSGVVETDDARDVYLYDRVTQSMERITNGIGGPPAVPANCEYICGSQRPTVSGDGRYVAYWSNATNLVAGDDNGMYDAFLYDRQTKTTTLISKLGTTLGNSHSRRPVVSRDGGWVAFESAAKNLAGPCGLFGVCPDNNNADDVFLYEVATGKVTLVSATPSGGPGNGASNRPSISANGRRIAFQSDATNLGVSDGNGTTDVYLRDLASAKTSLVSAGPSGIPGDKASTSPSISANGRFVSFDTKALNFAAGDTGGDIDIYVKDLDTGGVDQASVRTGGGQASGTNGSSKVGADSTISGDGRFVAFWSDVSTLVDGDTNSQLCDNWTKKQVMCADVFIRDRVAGTTTRVVSPGGAQADGDAYSPALSVDGRLVAFDSDANSLDPSAQSNTRQDILVRVNF
jgi:Tol biopolymer transport system component